MAKLGTEKHPLILRVTNESRVEEVARMCKEHDWRYIIGVEPDKEEDLSDLERKLNPPTQHVSTEVGRNAPCICGSGQKYKKCCGAAA